MSAETVIRTLVARVWNEDRFNELDKYFAPRVEHAGRSESVADVRAWHQADGDVWADSRYEVLSLVSDGRQVAIRWRATARHVGDWGPVAATGKSITWEGAHFFILDNEQVTAMWAIGDRFAKALQLGVVMTAPTE